jgi:hypothetical protein
MRISRIIRGLLPCLLPFRPAAALLAAEQAAIPRPLEIHRSGAELAVILTVLGVFWIVALGCAVTLRWRAREADRLYRLEQQDE